MSGFTFNVVSPGGAPVVTPVDFSLFVGYEGIFNWPDPLNYVEIKSGYVSIEANDGGSNHGNVNLTGFPYTFTFSDSGPTELVASSVAIEADRDWKFQTILTYDIQFLGHPLQTNLIKILPDTDQYNFFSTLPDLPNKPITPAPVDIGTGIVLLPTLSWEQG